MDLLCGEGGKEEQLVREETDTRGRRRKGKGMTGLLSAWLHVYPKNDGLRLGGADFHT